MTNSAPPAAGYNIPFLGTCLFHTQVLFTEEHYS